MTGNHFIDRLDQTDRNSLVAILDRVELKTGDILVEQGSTIDRVHFPVGGYLANIILMPDGQRLQTAVIGREGLSGLVPFLANAPCVWQVVSVRGGQALTCSAQRLRTLEQARPALQRRLLSLASFHHAEAAQLGVCNVFHSVEQRIARWMLTVADATGQSAVVVSQGTIALDLGAQRTSVVAGFKRLKAEGVVSHVRGVLEVRDFPALERRACGCYTRLRRVADQIGVGPIDGYRASGRGPGVPA